MKAVSFFIIQLLYLTTANAQISITSTLNSTGSSTANGPVQLEWSVGEQLSIRQFTTGSLILTTGILQGVTPVPTGIVYLPVSANEVRFYPNPARAFFQTSVQFTKPGKLYLQIYHANGILVASFNHSYSGNRLTYTYKTDQFAAGIYNIHILFVPTNGLPQSGISKLIIQP